MSIEYTRRAEVQSSWIDEAFYNDTTRELWVIMTNVDRLYGYANVGPTAFHSLTTSPNGSKYYNNSIRGEYLTIPGTYGRQDLKERKSPWLLEADAADDNGTYEIEFTAKVQFRAAADDISGALTKFIGGNEEVTVRSIREIE